MPRPGDGTGEPARRLRWGSPHSARLSARSIGTAVPSRY